MLFHGSFLQRIIEVIINDNIQHFFDYVKCIILHGYESFSIVNRLCDNKNAGREPGIEFELRLGDHLNL